MQPAAQSEQKGVVTCQAESRVPLGAGQCLNSFLLDRGLSAMTPTTCQEVYTKTKPTIAVMKTWIEALGFVWGSGL